MPFEYSCFISYRHGEGKLSRRIIEDLYEALTSEMELHTSKKIYLDKKRLEGGDFYNEQLAVDLCKSVCMIVVYTPTYFDADHVYCAREFRGMELLEKRRFRVLNDPATKRHGLIIPIIFRGSKHIPEFIKSKRQLYNFEKFSLVDKAMYRHPHYAPQIKALAEYIADRCRVFDGLEEDAARECENFRLPSARKVLTWLERLSAPREVFPGRREVS